MSWVLFILIIGLEIGSDGLVATGIGLAGALGIDVLTAFITGAGLASVFHGAGMLDDIILLFFKLGLGVPDKILLSVAAEQAYHVSEEAYEAYTHTAAQNRRYAAYLQRENPGETYTFGDVTHKDLYELGFSFGTLAYRGKIRDIFQAVGNRFADALGLEDTSDAIAIGADFI